MRGYLSALAFFLIAYVGWGQELDQTVIGQVRDNLTHAALTGASVQVSSGDFQAGSETNESGFYRIEKVPPGRYRIRISFTGYTTIEEELLVIAGKNTVSNYELVASSMMLQEVEVTSVSYREELPGQHTLSIEKTFRVPANYFDPVRVATSYPGVVVMNDQNNAIAVRGNSPNGLLWRLNGMDIVNPNHLSNAGTLSDKPMMNGGGVNILSAQMLDRTTFHTGAYPAHIGNLQAGAVDMALREGNRDAFEFTAQASLLGLDFSAEGPLTKNNSSSFLANYRYSTIGLLSQAGVDFGDEQINFQDLSFNLSFDRKRGGTIHVFGLGGMSKNTFTAKPVDERETAKDWYDIEFSAQTYALGGTYEVALSKATRLSLGVMYSASEQQRSAYLYDQAETSHLQDDYFIDESRLAGYFRVASRLGENSQIEFGANLTSYGDSLYTRSLPPGIIFNPCPGDCPPTGIDGAVSGLLLQPYAALTMSLSDRVKATAGFRYMRFGYNGSDAPEPRVSLFIQTTPHSEMVFAYNGVSQVQRMPVYLATGNENLSFTRQHNMSIAYTTSFEKDLRLKTQLFYQALRDVPVEIIPSTFSVLNALENDVPANLMNDGTGTNTGIDLLVEKYFYANQYFWLGGSYYKATYTPSDGETYDSRFNGRFTLNAVYGKEWYKAAKNRTITASTRILWLGGLKEQPIDVEASEDMMETVYDTSVGYVNQLKDYTRIDLRVSFRKDKPGYTRTLAIDIQNLFSIQNEAYHQYDFATGQVETRYQLGIIPMLVYRIDF